MAASKEAGMQIEDHHNREMQSSYMNNIKQEDECMLDDFYHEPDVSIVEEEEQYEEQNAETIANDTSLYYNDVYEIYEFDNDDDYRRYKQKLPTNASPAHCSYVDYDFPVVYSDDEMLNTGQPQKRKAHNSYTEDDFEQAHRSKQIYGASKAARYSITNKNVSLPQTYKNSDLYEKHFTRMCPFCGLEFSSDMQWRKHVNGMHHFGKRTNLNMEFLSGEKARCKQCDIVLNAHNFAALQQHNITHLPYGDFFKCRICHKQMASIGDIMVHIKVRHASILKRTTPTLFANKEYEAQVDEDNEDVEEEPDDMYDVSGSYNSYNNSMNFKASFHDKAAGTVIKSQRITSVEKLMTFTCPACPDLPVKCLADLNSHFRNIHDYFAHIFVVNADGTMYCTQCKKSFMNSKRRSMMKHQFSHLTVRPYGCKTCGFVAKDITKVKNHVTKKHLSGKTGKTVASLPRPTPAAVTVSVKQHSIPKATNTATNNSAMTAAIKATIAKAVAAKKSINLKMQTPDLSQISKARMAYCSDKTTALNQFHEHITYACPECNETLATQRLWHLHISSEHDFFEDENMLLETAEDGSKRCLECGIKLSGGTLHMQRHRLTHMPYKSFICSLCNHRSNTQNVLIDHIRRRHFAPGYFQCVMCALVFNTSYEQGVHMQQHNTEDWPATVCRICYRNFSKVSSLRVHMETHEMDRKKYACEFCDRLYLSTCEVRRHQVRAHSELLFNANYDDAGSSRKSTGESKTNAVSKMRCAICHHYFLSHDVLKAHLQTHEAEELAAATVCEICWLSFESKTVYQNHMKKHATVTLDDDDDDEDVADDINNDDEDNNNEGNGSSPQHNFEAFNDNDQDDGNNDDDDDEVDSDNDYENAAGNDDELILP